MALANTERGARRWRSFLKANWDLGFTTFGGPPVHFKIVSYSNPSLNPMELKKITLLTVRRVAACE